MVRTGVSRFSLRKIIAMTVAVLCVAAAVAAVWLNQGFLCTIGGTLLLGILYLVVFQTRWCYIALRTSKRDLT